MKTETTKYIVGVSCLSSVDPCYYDDKGALLLFNTKEDAQAEIDQHLKEVDEAVRWGDMLNGYDKDDYCIIECMVDASLPNTEQTIRYTDPISNKITHINRVIR